MGKREQQGTVVKPPKKKKNKCCSCLLAFGITTLVVFGGLFAAGWFIGDYFSQQYLDMSIVGAYFDVRMVSEKDMALREYSDADTDGFDAALRQALFLNDDVKIPYAELAGELLGPMLSGDGNPDTPSKTGAEIFEDRDTLLKKTMRSLGKVTAEAEDAAEEDPVVAWAESLLKRENIDLERLAQYNGEEHKIAFTDKQMAGFVANLLESYLETQPESDDPFAVGSILRAAELAQVKIGGTADDPVLRVTVRVNTAQYLKKMLKKTIGMELSFVVWMFAPEHTYLSVDLHMGETLSAGLQLNALDGDGMARINKIITKIAKQDIQAAVDGAVTENLEPAKDDFLSSLTLDPLAGSASMDVFGTALAVYGVNNDKPEEERITTSDFIYEMQYLLTSEILLNTDATYQNQYMDKESGEVSYMPADFTDASKYTLVDYKAEFLKEMKEKYFLEVDLSKPDSEFKRIAGLFGIGSDEGSGADFIEVLDMDELNGQIAGLARAEQAAYDGGTASGNKLVLTDRMLGVVFNEFIVNMLESDSSMSKLNPSVNYVILKKTGEPGAVHNRIEATFTVDLVGQLAGGEGGILADIISALLPEGGMTLTVDIDITPASAIDPETNPYEPGQLKYNDLTAEQTRNMLRVLTAFVPDLDFSQDGILAQIEQPFRDAVGKMFDLMPGIALGESYRENAYAGKALSAGTIFELVAQELNKRGENSAPEGETPEQTSAREIVDVIVSLWDVDSAALIERPAFDSYDGFMADIKDKYYINDPEDQINEYDDLLTVVDADGFNYENFNISGGGSSLAYDTRTAEDLQPFLDDREFAAIMRAELYEREGGTGTHTLSGFTEVASVLLEPSFERGGDPVDGAVSTGSGTGVSPDGYITIVICVDTKSFLSDKEIQYQSLLPGELYFKLRFDVSGAGVQDAFAEGADPNIDPPRYQYYGYEMQLNDMPNPSKGYDDLMKIIRLANSGNNPVEIDAVAREIGRTLYEKLGELRENIGAENLSFSARVPEYPAATDPVEYGFQIGSVFHFLAATSGDGNLTAEVLRGAIQGMYPYDAGTSEYNDNNYRYGGIVFNGISDAAPALPALSVSDSEFGYLLKTGNALLGLGDNNPFAGGEAYTLAQFDSAQTAGGARLTVTFAADLAQGFIGDGESGYRGDYWNLVPETMYFTFEIDWDAGTKQYTLVETEGEFFTINQMTAEEKAQLFAMIGYDPAGLSAQAEDCVTSLNALTQVSYGDHEVSLV